jgi:hypothetical protein
MSLDTLRSALEELAEPAFVEGSAKLSEPLSIGLPDGDVGALADKMFVAWLLEHAETAPFGQGGKTKVDKNVRNAQRLAARDKAIVAGFDPGSVLPEIEAALSPREHLDAKLTDVIIYPKGGKFAKHKDTPRDPDLVGTLVVGLPIAHLGGALLVTDSEGEHAIDWNARPDPNVVCWVALFSDADHEVEPVTSGTRVTLVYSLSRSKRARTDPKREQRVAKLEKVAATLTIGPKQPLMIACTRQVIAETGGKQPQSIEVLRGFDRDIADVLVERGFSVAVRSCMIDSENEGKPYGTAWAIARLASNVPAKVMGTMDYCVTYGETAEYDGEEMPDATCLAPYVLDTIPVDRWVIRANAAATLEGHAEAFSLDGYFGNEGYSAHIYTLAALEVTGGAKKTSAPKRLTKSKAKPKPKPKSKKR